MSDRFESLESGEVVSIQHETQVLSGHRTFRSGELNDAIKSYVEQAIAGWSEEKNDWFTDRGIDCEALRFGSKGWQKGRIRLSLEFCPDEPEMPALTASNIQTPVTTYFTDTPVSAPQTTPVASHDDVLTLEHEDAIAITSTATTSDRLKVATPVGIAATGAVAAATITNLDLEPLTNSTIPHLADAVLEPERHDLDPTSPISGSLEELNYIFDETNDDRGQLIPPGMMEMDLADGIDYSEHDLLSFEANGMSDSAEGFGSFQDIGRPEYSGALIDEVWTEIDRANWPKVT
jgi:KGK domain